METGLYSSYPVTEGVPLPDVRSVQWQNAKALRCSDEPLRGVALQPSGSLVACDALGPKFESADSLWARKRARPFIELANDSDADLVITPEYSIPRSSVDNLVGEQAERVGDGVVYVLPMSSMPLNGFEQLASIGDGLVNVTAGAQEGQ